MNTVESPKTGRRVLCVLTTALLLALGTACASTNNAAAPPSTRPSGSAPPNSEVPTSSAPTADGVRPSAGCHSGPTGAPPITDGTQTISVGGTTRTYELAVPTNQPAGRPSPLILLFHGYAGGAKAMSIETGLPELAKAAGNVVITPNGGGGTWQIDAHGTDATFVDAVVARVVQSTCVDLNRVGATGFSAGAAFAILYSCARPSMIAAIATVAVDFQLGCTKPMSILAFHGTKDPAVPFQDGAIGLSLPGLKVRGTELNLGDWARLDGCQPSPDTKSIGTEVTKQTWPRCHLNTEVVLYRIEGGGHTWPGADPASGIGLTTEQVSATNQIVPFLARHRLV